MMGRTLRAAGLAATTIAVAAAALPSVALAQRADGSTFSCRASALRADVNQPLDLPVVEPTVANPENAPCRPDFDSIIEPTTVGPVMVNLAVARTTQTPADLGSAPAAEGDNATSAAGVTKPVITLGALVISADVLSARASYTCRAGQPVPMGSSVVENLVVGGQAITLPPNNAPFTLDLGPLGSLSLNQTVQEPNRITQRAFFLTTPLGEVVIAEAIADFTGNPCKAAAAPQCSDARDNDGDGQIDAQDPGCLSGPNRTFNPNDDDETNPPQCSDGIDNDGDGRIDFPGDRGCTSPRDNSERTPRGQSRLGSDPAGIARLGVNGPCTRRSFAAKVTGRSIKRVVFSLDGRRVRTDTSAPFRTRISTGRSGTHRVTARVTFLSDSKTAARTLSFRFRRCAAPVRFTG